jgi:ComEC/Rec2-related protein
MIGLFVRGQEYLGSAGPRLPEEAITVVGQLEERPRRYPDGGSRVALRVAEIHTRNHTLLTDRSVSVKSNAPLSAALTGHGASAHGPAHAERRSGMTTGRSLAAGDRVRLSGVLACAAAAQTPGTSGAGSSARAGSRPGSEPSAPVGLGSRAVAPAEVKPAQGADPLPVCREYRLYAEPGELTRLSGAEGLRGLSGRAYGWLESHMRRVGDPQEGRGLGRERAALTWALMLGDRGYLTQTLSDAFRRAGVVHTLALSGMHLGVIAGGAALLLSRLVGRRRAALTSLLIAALYVVVVGVRPSLLRALVMYGLMVTGFLRDRRLQPMNLLGLTFIATILAWPSYAGELGFQLSFLSLSGMFVLGPPVAERLARRMPPLAAYPVAVSLSAFTATAPLLMATFGELHPVGIGASVLVGPLVTLFLGNALVQTVLAAAGLELLLVPLNQAANLLYQVIDTLVVTAARVPGLTGSLGWFGCALLLAVTGLCAALPVGAVLWRALCRGEAAP